MMSIIDEIRGYKYLEKDWHYEGGGPISDAIILDAIKMAVSLQSVGYHVSSSPTYNYGIQFALDFGCWIIELDLEEERTWFIGLHDKTDPDSEINIGGLSYLGALGFMKIFWDEKHGT